jgi:hypothetical protein
MPYKKRINNFPKKVLDRKLNVDGAETTIRDFLRSKFYGSRILSPNEVRSVIDLEPGDSSIIHDFKISRIA